MDSLGFDLSFRPLYWDVDGLLRAPTANIGGTLRRQAVQDVDDPDTLGALLAAPSDDERESLGRVHPAYMEGEYLPETEPGAVEIARVTLRSVTGDVFSVRATPNGARVSYDIAHEYEGELEFEPTSSDEPLTLGELISLIDGAEDPEWNGVRLPGLVEAFWQAQVDYDPSATPETAVRFATAESEFYPMLGDYYRARAHAWLAERKPASGRSDAGGVS